MALSLLGAALWLAPSPAEASDEDAAKLTGATIGAVNVGAVTWLIHDVVRAAEGDAISAEIAGVEAISMSLGAIWTMEFVAFTQVDSGLRRGARKLLSPVMRGFATMPMTLSMASATHGYLTWFGQDEIRVDTRLKLSAALGATAPFTAMAAVSLIFGGWHEPAVALPQALLSGGAGILSLIETFDGDEAQTSFGMAAGLAAINLTHAIVSLVAHDDDDTPPFGLAPGAIGEGGIGLMVSGRL